MLGSIAAVMGMQRASSAADRPCTAVRVVERAGLPPTWHDALDALRADVAQLDPSACTSTTVVVEPSAAGARVLVAAADGRQAERFVVTSEALRAVVLGLLATVPGESAPAAEPPPAAPSASSPPPPSPDPDDVPTFEPARLSRPPVAERAVGFHLAPAIGARFGAPTPVGMVDLVARFELRVHDWLVFAAGRYAFIGERIDGPRIPGWFYDEVALGIGLGRRLHLGELALDLAVVPEVVIVSEEGNVPVDGVGGSSDEIRVQALARVLAPVGGRLRPALMLDAEITPLAPTTPTRVDPALPPLPTWTIGLGAGVVWDVP